MIIRWLVVSLVIFVSPYVLPGIKVESFGTALIATLVLGVVSVTIGTLLKLITLPLNLLTVGLFSFIIYAVLIIITSKLIDGFVVVNFWWALLLGLIIFLVNRIL